MLLYRSIRMFILYFPGKQPCQPEYSVQGSSFCLSLIDSTFSQSCLGHCFSSPTLQWSCAYICNMVRVSLPLALCPGILQSLKYFVAVNLYTFHVCPYGYSFYKMSRMSPHWSHTACSLFKKIFFHLAVYL